MRQAVTLQNILRHWYLDLVVVGGSQKESGIATADRTWPPQAATSIGILTSCTTWGSHISRLMGSSRFYAQGNAKAEEVVRNLETNRLSYVGRIVMTNCKTWPIRKYIRGNELFTEAGQSAYKVYQQSPLLPSQGIILLGRINPAKIASVRKIMGIVREKYNLKLNLALHFKAVLSHASR